MQNDSIIKLIGSLALNYPILKDMGFRLPGPLLLLVPDVSTETMIVNTLSWVKERRLSLYEKADPWEVLKNCSSEAVFLNVDDADFLRSNKLSDRLELLLSASSGHIGERNIECLLILVSKKGIPERLNGRVFAISIENAEGKRLDYRYLIPAPKDFGLIKSRTTERAEVSDVEPILLAAAYCVYPEPEEEAEKQELRALCDTAELLSVRAQCYVGADGLSELFRISFREWMATQENLSGFELSNLPDGVENIIEESLFFNNKGNVYIHPKLFEAIGEELIRAVGENALKNALAAAGILIPEKGAQSCRMYYRVQGATSSKRMLKFNIDALDQVGEVSLYDLCFQEKEV